MPFPKRRSSSSSRFTRTLGQRALAAADDDGHEEELALVDQPGRDRLRRELGTADRDVARRRRLELPDRLGVEIALDPRPGAGHRLQRPE